MGQRLERVRADARADRRLVELVADVADVARELDQSRTDCASRERGRERLQLAPQDVNGRIGAVELRRVDLDAEDGVELAQGAHCASLASASSSSSISRTACASCTSSSVHSDMTTSGLATE